MTCFTRHRYFLWSQNYIFFCFLSFSRYGYGIFFLNPKARIQNLHTLEFTALDWVKYLPAHSGDLHDPDRLEGQCTKVRWERTLRYRDTTVHLFGPGTDSRRPLAGTSAADTTTHFKKDCHGANGHGHNRTEKVSSVPLNSDIPEPSWWADRSIWFPSSPWRWCSWPSAHLRHHRLAVLYSSGHKPGEDEAGVFK